MCISNKGSQHQHLMGFAFADVLLFILSWMLLSRFIMLALVEIHCQHGEDFHANIRFNWS